MGLVTLADVHELLLAVLPASVGEHAFANATDEDVDGEVRGRRSH